MDQEMVCQTCHKTVSGGKCVDCGVVADVHDAQHSCGESRCQPKCVGCDEAEEKCSCPAETSTAA